MTQLLVHVKWTKRKGHRQSSQHSRPSSEPIAVTSTIARIKEQRHRTTLVSSRRCLNKMVVCNERLEQRSQSEVKQLHLQNINHLIMFGLGRPLRTREDTVSQDISPLRGRRTSHVPISPPSSPSPPSPSQCYQFG